MMTCVEAEELLLESLDEPIAGNDRRRLDAHVQGCVACAVFATRMRAVDATLATALIAPPLDPMLMGAIRKRQGRERASAFADTLPDLIHLGGCGVATLLSAALLPLEASSSLGTGILFTCVTYVLLVVVRSSLEAAEQPDW